MGRLKPNVTIAQADAEMKGIAKQIAQEFPKSKGGWSASVEPLKNNFLDRRPDLHALAAARRGRLRAADRVRERREPAARARHGAPARDGGARVARRVARTPVRAAAHRKRRARRGRRPARPRCSRSSLMDGLLALIPPNTLPSEADMTLNVPVLLFTLAVSLLSGVLFGSAPAWQVKRINLNDVLKETGRSTIGGGRHWMRRMFVVTEFALALTLLAGAGLAISSLVKLANVDLGFKTERLLTMSLPVPDTRLKGARADRDVLSPGARTGARASGRVVRVGVHGHPGARHELRHAVHDRRPSGERSGAAPRRRLQHGDAGLLQDVRHPDSARTRLHRAGFRRRAARRDRQRRVRAPASGRPRSAQDAHSSSSSCCREKRASAKRSSGRSSASTAPCATAGRAAISPRLTCPSRRARGPAR